MEKALLKQTLLIVDDEPSNIKILNETLRSDYEIRFALNGTDALQAAISDNPDLVLLDIVMPEMDGYEVCSRLMASVHTRDIPIIFITAQDDEREETKGFKIGAVDYIKKPFNPTVVKARVETHLSLKRAQKALKNQNAVLKEKVRERTAELENTQIEIVKRLGQAAEYRDEETGNHIKRMSEYCRFLGQLSGLSPDESDMLALSSTMHDLGKIGIPDNILLKPGKLTADEWKIMKTHTTIGAKMLSGIKSSLLNMAETIALTHHEKWDGSGYPMGIKKTEIPLEGRITCICDVFDALTSERPYKRAWRVEDAIDEINNGSGSHFDPELVEHFNTLISKLKVVKEKLK